jgi:lipopolysaccharide export system permease protein
LRTLHRYLLRETLLAFGFVFVGIATVVLFGTTARALSQWEGLPLVLVGEYVGLLLLYLVPYFFPVSLLIAVLLAYGRFAGDNETVAVQAGGIRAARLLVPALLLGIPFSAGCLYALDRVQPDFHFVKREFLRDAVKRISHSFGAGARNARIGHLLVSWDRAVADEYGGWAFEGFLLLELAKGGEPAWKVTAKRAKVEFLTDSVKLRMEDYRILLDARQSGGKAPPASEAEAPRVREILEVGGTGEVAIAYDEILPGGASTPGVEDLRTVELLRVLDSAAPPYPRAEIRTEIHKRLSLTFASCVFALVGAPLAIRLRRGNRMLAIFLGTAIVLGVYYPLFHTADFYASRGDAPAAILWGPNAILSALGVVLAARLDRAA